MKPDLLPLLLAAVVLAPFPASAAPSDRHPGVYQFTPLAPGECAQRQRERRLVPRRERMWKLADLPAAYVIRLGDSKPAPRAGSARAFAAPAYDPCAMIERVK